MGSNFVNVRMEQSATTFSGLSLAMLHWQNSRSLIVILGWLDTSLPPAIVRVGSVLAAIGFLADALSYGELDIKRRISSLLGILAYTFLFLLIMLAAWVTTAGVHGRYFLPILPLLAAAFGMRTVPKGHPIAPLIFLPVAPVYLILFATELPRVLLYRYWLRPHGIQLEMETKPP